MTEVLIRTVPATVYVIVACDGEYSGKSWDPVLVVANPIVAQRIYERAIGILKEYEDAARSTWASSHYKDPRGWYGVRAATRPKYDAMIAGMGLGSFLADDYEMHAVEYLP